MRAAAVPLALLAALAAALPAAHGEDADTGFHMAEAHAQEASPAGRAEAMVEYGGEEFTFMYPESWSVYDAAVAEWDGWRVPVWAFGSDGQSIDSRLYVARIPPVIGEGERWGDGVYLARMAANEADFCDSGEIAWGRYSCASYSVTHSSHYHYTQEGANFLLVYEWVREYGDGTRVETTSARVDVISRFGTFVMYAEAPTERWNALGLIDSVKSFAPAAGAFPEPRMDMVDEGVYNYYSWGYGSLVVVGEDGVLVTDPASSARAEGLKEAIAGVTDLPVRWIALTHEHYDHVGGTGVFPEAKVVCQHSCEPIFGLSDLLDVPGAVDIEFDSLHEIDTGGITVELHHIVPSDGEATTVIYLPEQRVLASADLYTPGGLTNALFLSDTNLLGLRHTLNEVAGWEVDHALNNHYADSDVDDLLAAAEFLNDLHDAIYPRLAAAQEAGGSGALYRELADLPHEVDLPQYASWDNYGDLPHYVARMVESIIHGG